MLTKQDYETLVNCMTTKTRENGDEFYVIKESTPKHITDFVHDFMYKMDGSIATLDLQYEIMQAALSWLSDSVEYEQITGDNTDAMYGAEHASIYTGARLSYLNPLNDNAIADIVKENICDDISTACAIWYDQAVNERIDELIDAIVAYEYKTE